MFKRLLFLFLFFACRGSEFTLQINNGKELNIPDTFVEQAKEKHKEINSSIFFHFKKDPQEFNQKFKEAGEHVLIKTENGKSLRGLFLNRYADKLVIVMPAAFVSIEKMAEYIELIDCDLLLVDFRWAKTKYGVYKKFYAPYRAIIYKPIDDVIAAIKFGKRQKNYRHIVGCGMCYSSWQFILAQAKMQSLDMYGFDALILDSCGSSLHDFVESWIKDPYLGFRFGFGGAPNWIKNITNQRLIRKFLVTAGKLIPPFSIKDALSKIHSTPMLFTQGIKDVLVDYDIHFKKIFNVAPEPKILLTTPFYHAINTFKAKEMLKEAMGGFIASLDAEDNLTSSFLSKFPGPLQDN